jgi:hypothetical protein
MDENTKTSEFALLVSAGAYDPLEDEVRQRVRGFIEAILEEELRPALGRGRYVRSAEGVRGRRNGHRERQVIGTFGPETVKVPRVRLVTEDGRTSEWRSKSLRRYQRLTKKAEALIDSVYLAGTNTRRVKRALFGLFDGAVSKDVVSRAWRKVKTDWEAWNARSLADEDIVRLILDGTVVKTRIDRKTTVISVLAAIGVRRDGQKVLLSIRNMGGESKAAWRMFLDDLDARGLKAPEFVIVDGAPRLEAALTELWPDTPVQRSGRRDRGRGDLASLPSRPVLYPAPFPPSPGELALLDPKCCIDRLTCFARSCEGVVDGLEQPVALAAVVRDLKHGPTSWGSGRLRANIPHRPWQDQRVFDGLAWPPSAARRLKTSLRLTSSAAPIIVVSSAAAEGL